MAVLTGEAVIRRLGHGHAWMSKLHAALDVQDGGGPNGIKLWLRPVGVILVDEWDSSNNEWQCVLCPTLSISIVIPYWAVLAWATRLRPKGRSRSMGEYPSAIRAP